MTATKTYDRTSSRPDRPVGALAVFLAVLMESTIVGIRETPTTMEIMIEIRTPTNIHLKPPAEF
jgi:hypothetical protein